jgi:accessory gene regulator B
MINRISDRITENLVKSNIIADEDRELYHFGLYQGMIFLLNLAVAMLIGILTGMLFQMAIFLTCFALLRRYSGGYHEKTQLRCFFSSMFMMLFAILIIKYMTVPLWCYGIIILIAGSCIFILAPMEHENRTFLPEELKIYKRIARIIWGVETVFLIMILYVGWVGFADCVAVALACVSLLLIIGKIEAVWEVRKGAFDSDLR